MRRNKGRGTLGWSVNTHIMKIKILIDERNRVTSIGPEGARGPLWQPDQYDSLGKAGSP